MICGCRDLRGQAEGGVTKDRLWGDGYAHILDGGGGVTGTHVC